jgi:hypothetical protein
MSFLGFFGDAALACVLGADLEELPLLSTMDFLGFFGDAARAGVLEADFEELPLLSKMGFLGFIGDAARAGVVEADFEELPLLPTLPIRPADSFFGAAVADGLVAMPLFRTVDGLEVEVLGLLSSVAAF